MSDHTKFAALAVKLIAKHGRQITLQKLQGGAVDPAKPWAGNTVPTVSEARVVTAVFVPSTGEELGKEIVSDDLLKLSEQVALIAPGQTSYEGFHTIVDGAQTFKIVYIKVLKPGDQVLLYAIGVTK